MEIYGARVGGLEAGEIVLVGDENGPCGGGSSRLVKASCCDIGLCYPKLQDDKHRLPPT